MFSTDLETESRPERAHRIRLMTKRLLGACAILVCAHPQAMAAYNVIGGEGGRTYTLQCPPGRYAVGIAARHDQRSFVKPTEAIIQLRLRGVGVDPGTGNWSGSHAWTAWSPTDRLEGTQGLEYDSSTCPTNQFIGTVIHGQTTQAGFATVVGQLDGLCVRFDQIDPGRGTSRKRVIDARSRFGNRTEDQRIAALQPGERRNLAVRRPTQVRRCVTLGRVPGGCYECAGQPPYQDPRLVIEVDTGTVISESDERNNQVTR